ncbi:hypothetical protein Q8A73_000712 [Channa argus]|nr:hypothetical protein Q8A73_000712 [Channa argus]
MHSPPTRDRFVLSCPDSSLFTWVQRLKRAHLTHLDDLHLLFGNFDGDFDIKQGKCLFMSQDQTAGESPNAPTAISEPRLSLSAVLKPAETSAPQTATGFTGRSHGLPAAQHTFVNNLFTSGSLCHMFDIWWTNEV